SKMESRMANVADKLVEEAQGSLLAVVTNEISYTWHCRENVEKLRLEVGKLKNGAAFESDVSIPTPLLGPLELNPRKDHNELDTQKSALENIKKSIEDESLQIIGIYGTGGVGKTTLAREVAAMVN
nr:disease resistance protein At4g27190-like [Tanacetum cinerariifolium]